MKNKETSKEAKQVLDFTINILEELENTLEKDYCHICAHNDKKTLKIFKKNSKIIFKTFSEIINRKTLKIQ